MDDATARQLLAAERDRLRGLLADADDPALHDNQSEASSELSSYDQHPADAASDTAERQTDQSLIEGLQVQLAEVEEAVARLERGEYGRCAVDGQPIPDERLKVVPAARYCVVHQAEAEHAEGL